MIRVRWTIDAANDLARIVERIREDNPAAARRVAQTIFEGIQALRTFPNRGRSGIVRGARTGVRALALYRRVRKL